MHQGSDDVTRLYFAIQTRLHRTVDGSFFTVANYARYEKWTEYFGAFDEVHLICRVSDSTEVRGFRVDGPKVFVHPLPTYRSWYALLRHFPAIIQRLWQLPVLHTDTLGGRLFDALSFLMFLRARIPRRHNFLAEVVGDPVAGARLGTMGLPGRVGAPLIGLVMRRIAKSADGSIYVTKDTLQKLYPPRQGRPTVSYSSVEVPLRPGRFVARDYRTNPILDPLRLLAVGSQEQRYKGHDLLIRATKALVEADISVKTTIVGGGRFHAELRELVQELGLEEVVTLTGTVVAREEIDVHYRAADLFVLPSRTEGLCRALIEAMSWGNACIASNVGGNPELLPEQALFDGDSTTALVEKLNQVRDSQETLNEIAIHGVRVSKQYSMDALVSRAEERAALLRTLSQLRP